MMRARGAKATDVVILVVAADDGVMPQTIEAIEHSKAAKVPMIVAINKIDSPTANVDKVKQELAAQGLQPIDWGGDIEMVEVSAKKHQNLDTLLETVLFQADIMDLKASPTRRASGVVLEAKLDKGRGSVATFLFNRELYVSAIHSLSVNITEKFVQCLMIVVKWLKKHRPQLRLKFSDFKVFRKPVMFSRRFPILIKLKQSPVNDRCRHGRSQCSKRPNAVLNRLVLRKLKNYLLYLKADVQGSVEVLKATLEKLSTEKVKVRVIRSGVGAISESDVLLASATQSDNDAMAVVIIGFNVRPGSRAAEVAKQEEVDIRLHSIIYKVEEEITAAMIGMLDKIEKEEILGKALVQDTFQSFKSRYDRGLQSYRWTYSPTSESTTYPRWCCDLDRRHCFAQTL